MLVLGLCSLVILVLVMLMVGSVWVSVIVFFSVRFGDCCVCELLRFGWII